MAQQDGMVSSRFRKRGVMVMRKNFCFPVFSGRTALLWILSAVFGMILLPAAASEPGAADWDCSVVQGRFLDVRVRIPADLYAYPEETMPELSPVAEPAVRPKPKRHKDPLLDEEVDLYPGPGEYRWRYDLEKLRFPLQIRVKWQMCRRGTDAAPGICLMPGSAGLASFASREELLSGKPGPVSGEAAAQDGAMEPDEGSGDPVLLAASRVLRRENGYLSAPQFLSFIRGESPSSFSFAGRGILMTLLLALLGGVALNLTPCVLPLIPVNLAVIGAGAQSGSPRSIRILRGLLYGAGIACTYGILGVAAVLTGSTFGALSSSWILNLLAAVVFLALGLAMFGVLNFDLSRLQGRFRMPAAAGLGGVFLMGGLSAVLAGACVAPVIAAALLEASRLAAEGNYAGLFLPFLVGLGMALPWPFAAAGLSLLPRPGAWMKHVKYVLGVLILLLALYCGVSAFSLLHAQYRADREPENAAGADDLFFPRINEALAESNRTGHPVLLYFGASWCKACRMMEASTFRDPDVEKALEDEVVFVRIHTEHPDEPAAANLLKAFHVQGLPVSLILKPERL